MRSQTVSDVKMANEKQKEDLRSTVLGALGEVFETLAFDDAQLAIGAKGKIVTGVRKVFEEFVQTKSVKYWLD